MKRRNFLGSLFAAGAVVKSPEFIEGGNDKPGSNEVANKWATIAVRPKRIPVYGYFALTEDATISGSDLSAFDEAKKIYHKL